MESRVPTDESDYTAILTLYYEEEIMGEAYFMGLARHFPEPHQQLKLSLLSRIERCVADSVHPLLLRHSLVARSETELHAIGVGKITRYEGSTWRKFLEDITVTFPRFIDEFSGLERIAPRSDRALLKPFTTHESVGIEFADRELSGDPDSVATLQRYILTFQG